jgi:hypothetical protein
MRIPFAVDTKSLVHASSERCANLKPALIRESSLARPPVLAPRSTALMVVAAPGARC